MGRKGKKSGVGAGEVLRIAGGVILGYLSITGIRNAIVSFQKGNTASIITTVMAIPICLLFLMIAFAMVYVSLPMRKRRKKKEKE
jgi:uncharacterized BrkB/YihY/UPF0761 family membrane protein